MHGQGSNAQGTAQAADAATAEAQAATGNGPGQDGAQSAPAAPAGQAQGQGQGEAGNGAQAGAQGTGEGDAAADAAAAEAAAREAAAAEAAEAAKAAEAAIIDRISKALGISQNDDSAPSAEELTANAERSAAEAKAARLELSIYRAAESVGANGAALTDSRSFMDSVSSVDPSDTKAIQAAIRSAMDRTPSVRRAPVAGRSGGDGTGTTPGAARPSDLRSAIEAEYQNQ